MSIEGLILFLLIGLAAGWLANKITKGSNKSLLSNLLVGCIGAIIGGYLNSIIGLSLFRIAILDNLLIAFLGALLLLFIIRLIRK